MKKLSEYFISYRLAYESNFLADKVVEYFLKNFSLISSYIKEVKNGQRFFYKRNKKTKFQSDRKKIKFSTN